MNTEADLLAAYVAGWNDGYGRVNGVHLPEDEEYVREAGFDEWFAQRPRRTVDPAVREAFDNLTVNGWPRGQGGPSPSAHNESRAPGI